jgi:hypothetical protein
MTTIFAKTSNSLSKKRQFFAKCFGENILKIITSVPEVMSQHFFSGAKSRPDPSAGSTCSSWCQLCHYPFWQKSFLNKFLLQKFGQFFAKKYFPI